MLSRHQQWGKAADKKGAERVLQMSQSIDRARRKKQAAASGTRTAPGLAVGKALPPNRSAGALLGGAAAADGLRPGTDPAAVSEKRGGLVPSASVPVMRGAR
jgi:hypothetical protein